MIRWSPRYGLIAGIILIIAANAVVLGGAMINRSGTPDAKVTMTERELPSPSRFGSSRENSGISLRPIWRVAGEGVPYLFSLADWLDRKKLADLGFDVSVDPDTPKAQRRYQKILPKNVFLVLEYDGAAYQAVLDQSRTKLKEEQALLSDNSGKPEFQKRVQSAKETLSREEYVNSRLIVIDAGTDHDVLRSKYPNRSQYIITTGEVRLTLDIPRENEDRFYGRIQRTAIRKIHVPRDYRAVLDQLPKRTFAMRSDPPRYSVTVKFGKRLKPWITDISPL